MVVAGIAIVRILPGLPTAGGQLNDCTAHEIQQDAALLIVAKWPSGGLPEPMTKGVRPLADIFEVDTILNAVKSSPSTTTDAERIVAALRTRELIETAGVKADLGSEHLIAFLEHFWNYEGSPYVRDKLAHEHRIGRRHCYEMALWIRHYWKPYFNDRRMIEIRKNDLQAFSLVEGRETSEGKDC